MSNEIRPNQVLAVSVVYEGEKKPAAKLPPISETLGPICPVLDRKFLTDKAFLEISDCKDLENFYADCMVAKKRLQRQFSDLSVNFFLALGSGPNYEEARNVAQDLLAAIIHNKAEVRDGVVLYITHEVYEHLQPRYRDNYHSSIDIESIPAHRRFSEDGLDCFVASPIGTENDAIRKRADFVFERYIKPACEATNYRARRADMSLAPNIVGDMKKRLDESRMVVVYLGSPKYGGWNPNVMWEFGFRVRAQKPLILLKDGTANSEPYSLPFDIADYRYVDIPEDDRNESKEEYGSRVRRIRLLLESDDGNGAELTYPYPSATVEVAAKKAIIIEKTGDLEQLFDVSNVLRKDLQSEILPHLYDCMSRKQVAAFQREQSELIGKVLLGECEGVHATVPMVFSEHRTMRGRAFLPVIVSHSNISNVLRLNIIYVEVTGVLKPHADGYFYCDLVGQPLPEPADDDEPSSEPPVSDDKSSVVPIREGGRHS